MINQHSVFFIIITNSYPHSSLPLFRFYKIETKLKFLFQFLLFKISFPFLWYFLEYFYKFHTLIRLYYKHPQNTTKTLILLHLIIKQNEGELSFSDTYKKICDIHDDCIVTMLFLVFDHPLQNILRPILNLPKHPFHYFLFMKLPFHRQIHRAVIKKGTLLSFFYQGL